MVGPAPIAPPPASSHGEVADLRLLGAAARIALPDTGYRRWPVDRARAGRLPFASGLRSTLPADAGNMARGRRRSEVLKPPVPSYLIEEREGYAPEVGKLVAMMEYARWTT